MPSRVFLVQTHCVLTLRVEASTVATADPPEGVIFLVMAGFVVYMVQDSCKNMTMYCLFMLGLMASFQCFFDALALFSVLGGRETSVSSVQGTENNVTVITRITQHPFFDRSMSEQYNTQSAVLLASPLVMSLLASMCRLARAVEYLQSTGPGPLVERVCLGVMGSLRLSLLQCLFRVALRSRSRANRRQSWRVQVLPVPSAALGSFCVLKVGAKPRDTVPQRAWKGLDRFGFSMAFRWSLEPGTT